MVADGLQLESQPGTTLLFRPAGAPAGTWPHMPWWHCKQRQQRHGQMSSGELQAAEISCRNPPLLCCRCVQGSIRACQLLVTRGPCTHAAAFRVRLDCIGSPMGSIDPLFWLRHCSSCTKSLYGLVVWSEYPVTQCYHEHVANDLVTWLFHVKCVPESAP